VTVERRRSLARTRHEVAHGLTRPLPAPSQTEFVRSTVAAARTVRGRHVRPSSTRRRSQTRAQNEIARSLPSILTKRTYVRTLAAWDTEARFANGKRRGAFEPRQRRWSRSPRRFTCLNRRRRPGCVTCRSHLRRDETVLIVGRNRFGSDGFERLPNSTWSAGT
jgi:hypothetical protein